MKGKQRFLSFVHNVFEVSVSMVSTGGGGLSSTGVPDSKIIFLNTAGFSLPKDGGPGAAGPYPRSATKYRGRRTRKRIPGAKGETTGYRCYIRSK